jgi:methionyl aminopeptidase
MDSIEKYINAGEIHKKVREYIQSYIQPGIKYTTICNLIESKISDEINKIAPNQLNNGIAFPTGISVNNVAAHFTTSYIDESIIKSDDVIKIDYGVHIDGCIIDSAFTINLNEEYNDILKASDDAVNTIIKNIGVDSRFKELSVLSQEVVESYEHDGKSLKVIDNLAGHNILPWKIHGGKLLHGKPTNNIIYDDLRVEEDDIMAIEVFVSNGNGTTVLDDDYRNYSHYMLKDDMVNIPLFKNKKTNELSNIITKTFKTLAFCPRFIDTITQQHTNYNDNLQELFTNGYLNSYPPLLETDIESKVAQFEHTMYIGETKKIIFS